MEITDGAMASMPLETPQNFTALAIICWGLQRMINADGTLVLIADQSMRTASTVSDLDDGKKKKKSKEESKGKKQEREAREAVIGKKEGQKHEEETAEEALDRSLLIYSEICKQAKVLLKRVIRAYSSDGVHDSKNHKKKAVDLIEDPAIVNTGIGVRLLYTYSKLYKKNLNDRVDIEQAVKLLASLGGAYTKNGWKFGQPLYILLRPVSKAVKLAAAAAKSPPPPPKFYKFVKLKKVFKERTFTRDVFCSPCKAEVATVLHYSKCLQAAKYEVTLLDSVDMPDDTSFDSADYWQFSLEEVVHQCASFMVFTKELTGLTVSESHEVAAAEEKAYAKRVVKTDGKAVVKEQKKGKASIDSLTKMVLSDKKTK